MMNSRDNWTVGLVILPGQEETCGFEDKWGRLVLDSVDTLRRVAQVKRKLILLRMIMIFKRLLRRAFKPNDDSPSRYYNFFVMIYFCRFL